MLTIDLNQISTYNSFTVVACFYSYFAKAAAACKVLIIWEEEVLWLSSLFKNGNEEQTWISTG